MSDKINCTFIGHSTVLLRIGATNIITDLHLGNRVLLVKRATPLNVDLTLLDTLSCILISHMHYDHLNIGSFKFISSAIPVVVPEGTEPLIGHLINNPIIELSHWATHELTDGTEITAVPVMHRGGRISQLRYTSSNAYIIRKGDLTVFFCGDSAYGPQFKEIGNLYRIDLALLPIGAYEPRWFMKTRHMTPAEAITAFEDLSARKMIPIHWGTFRLSFEKLSAPMEWLGKIIEERPDLKDRVAILEPGESRELDVRKDAGAAS